MLLILISLHVLLSDLETIARVLFTIGISELANCNSGEYSSQHIQIEKQYKYLKVILKPAFLSFSSSYLSVT